MKDARTPYLKDSLGGQCPNNRIFLGVAQGYWVLLPAGFLWKVGVLYLSLHGFAKMQRNLQSLNGQLRPHNSKNSYYQKGANDFGSIQKHTAYSFIYLFEHFLFFVLSGG